MPYVQYIFIRDKPILSSERTLQKGYDWEKKALIMSLKGLGARTN
jgi:hypothetical protein